MIEKFNGIFYLIVFLVHFVIFAVYAYQTVFATKKFLDKFGIDDTGAGMTRFFGSLFIGAVAMAIWVGSSAAREAAGSKSYPSDLTIVGIIDHWDPETQQQISGGAK